MLFKRRHSSPINSPQQEGINPMGLVPEAYKHMNLKLKDSLLGNMQLLTGASEST